MKKIYILSCLFCLTLNSIAAPKQMKEIGTINIPGANLLTTPVLQGKKGSAAYLTQNLALSIIDSRGATINGYIEHPAPNSIKDMQIVGFANYNLIMYYKMTNGTERFYSYKMSKKGLKILGSTAEDKFIGQTITNVSFDAKNICIVFHPTPKNGETVLTQKMIQYTTKLAGMKEPQAPKYNYETSINSKIVLPILKNKYKYDIITTYSDEEQTQVKNITVKILK